MITIKQGFSAFLLLVLLTLASSASAQTSMRTFELTQGDTQTPAMPANNLTGGITYYSGFVMGRVINTNPTTFSFLLSFNGGSCDSTTGICSGTTISNSSFAITEAVGRKSVSTSGTIDSGATVTYSLLPDGRAEIISVLGNLTIWEGKNSKRKVVGNGTVDYGTSTEGAGSMTLIRY